MVLLASVALAFVVGDQYRTTQKVGDSVIRGQAELLMIAARAHAPLDLASLSELLEAHRADGLRYIAVTQPPGQVEVGESSIGIQQTAPGHYVRRRGRVQFHAPGPPPHPRPQPLGPHLRQHSPEHEAPRGPPRVGPPGMAPSMIVIEFEPLAWMELNAAAKRQVGGGVFVLIALWIALLLGWRAIGNSEAQALTIERQKRLAMLGEMSATLAHEIRNPLTSLKGHAQLMVESAIDAKNKTRSQRIVAEAVRLENLTSDLLSFLRSGEIAIDDNDPKALMADVCEAEPRIVVDDTAAPASWEFDAPRLRQALTNLVENALQAGDGDVHVALREEGEVLLFVVDDRGDGIDESIAAHMFEPFVTSRTRGTGLGLAMALRVAQAHGGTITAASREGGGSRFVLRIPQRKNNE